MTKDTELREKIARVIADETEHFFSRRAMDKSCYEVIEDLDPSGPITDEGFKVISRHKTFERAEEKVKKLSAERKSDAILALLSPGQGRENALEEAAKLIDNERARQIASEGWSAEHDDKHTDNELLRASVSYFMAAKHGGEFVVMPYNWPWEKRWWKPKYASRNLEIAGALALAERDRVRRKYGSAANTGPADHKYDQAVRLLASLLSSPAPVSNTEAALLRNATLEEAAAHLRDMGYWTQGAAVLSLRDDLSTKETAG